MKVHCRCRKSACQKRFKGTPDKTPCPACGGPGRLDKYQQAKPWRKNLCHCDGLWWSIRAPHRRGCAGCNYKEPEERHRLEALGWRAEQFVDGSARWVRTLTDPIYYATHSLWRKLGRWFPRAYGFYPKQTFPTWQAAMAYGELMNWGQP